VENSGEDVAPEIVRPKGMCPTRCLHGIAQILIDRIIGGEVSGKKLARYAAAKLAVASRLRPVLGSRPPQS